jgi:hypothetical protein
VLVPPEPVSPELILVDPELAERERARLREKAALEAYLAGHPAPSLPQPLVAEPQLVTTASRLTTREFLRRRVLPAALVASLFANGYFVADVVLRTDGEASTAVAVAVRPAATVASAPVRTPTPVARKTIVEQKLVSLVLSAPARKLPRAFVDPKTGLVRNNVQVVCRAAKHRSYLCTVRLANARSRKALVVRYGPTRAGGTTFTWYGYKLLK